MSQTTSHPIPEWIQQYRAMQKAAIDSIPGDAVARLIAKFRCRSPQDKQIFAFGNGGKRRQRLALYHRLGQGLPATTFSKPESTTAGSAACRSTTTSVG